MAKKKNSTYISFDASIIGKTVGIGVYNGNNGESLHFEFDIQVNSSRVAEEMALICAIEYANDLNLHHPFFFTDNINLFKDVMDNQKKYLNKYQSIMTDFISKKTLNLHWIPREFNKKADALSKIKSEIVSAKKISNKNKKVKKIKNRNSLISSITSKQNDTKYIHKAISIILNMNNCTVRTKLKEKFRTSEISKKYIDFFFQNSANNKEHKVIFREIMDMTDNKELKKLVKLFIIINFFMSKKTVNGAGKGNRNKAMSHINHLLDIEDVRSNKNKYFKVFVNGLI
jgi:ribonuclease HI